MTTGPSGIPDFDSFEWEHLDGKDLFADTDPLENSTVAYPQMPPPPVTATERPESNAAPEVPATSPVQRASAGPQETPESAPGEMRRRARRWPVDPMFSHILLLGLSFGLTPLAVESPNGRYAILWTAMALVVIVSHVLVDGTLEVRLRRDQLLWGAGWGLIVGLPLLLVGPGLLSEVSRRIFVAMPVGALFQTIVFVMATTESAFFRGMLQETRSAAVVSTMASVWSILLFFPTMDVLGYPFIALIAGTFIVLLNILYSYVQQRNGVAAAWVTQTLVSLAWLFLPRL